MMPSFTRQGENERASPVFKKKMATAHGEVKVVNKTGIVKLNRQLRKDGKLDFDQVGYKKLDITGHKPPVKKKW